MAGPYILRKNVSRLNDLLGGNAAIGIGAGNVYYVVQAANTYVYTFAMENLMQYYSDDTPSVHTNIQSALDATVANRNDYVIVFPDSSDYDITAALTMSKKAVHLICPAGLNTNGFPTNAARIHQNTASTAYITVTGDAVEIAGFFFKQDATSRDNIIHLSGTRWHPVIHDNFFGMSATAGTSKYGIYADGACSHFSICNNYFTNYNPGAMTGTDNDVAGFISIANNGSTRGLIRGNIMHPGANTAVAKCIEYGGFAGFIIGNYLFEDPAFGSSQAGVITLGISTSAHVFVSDNRVGMGTPANGVVGGTANVSYVQNWEAASGNTIMT